MVQQQSERLLIAVGLQLACFYFKENEMVTECFSEPEKERIGK